MVPEDQSEKEDNEKTEGKEADLNNKLNTANSAGTSFYVFIQVKTMEKLCIHNSSFFFKM